MRKKTLFTIFLICLTTTLAFSQTAKNVYNWNNLEQVRIYDLTSKGIQCYSDSLVEKAIKDSSVLCDAVAWKQLLSQLSGSDYEIHDVANENKCIILVFKFNDGTTIPFKYFPGQIVLFDIRKDHFNYLTFKKSIEEKISALYNSCIK
jgi:hypothetical protein